MVVAGLIVVSPAQAVNWGWLQDAPVQSFTDQDWELFRQTARNAVDTLPDGESSSWENPDSRNGGSVTVLKTLEETDQHCRMIEIINRTNGNTGTSRSTVCRQADGSWKTQR
ncbi:MAG: RT0821/Lpp0805 family surface protein [bacterium]